MMVTEKHRELREKIKQQIQIVDIADEFGLTVTNRNRKIASLREHDSVNIYQETNSFYRNATGVGGDVLKFMEEMPEINMNYMEAFKLLAPRIDPTLEIKSIPQVKKEMVLHDAKERSRNLQKQICSLDDNTKNVKAYLIKVRKIAPKIVYDFIEKGMLMQETNKDGYKSALFIGYDEQGMVAAICKRACSPQSKFKQEAKGCDYSYGWLYDPEVDSRMLAYGREYYNPNKTLICFESEIEKMSYLSLMKLEGKDINQYAYLSTGSANKYKTIIDVVKRNGYKEVLVGYNNDGIRVDTKIDTGKKFADKAVAELREIGVKAERIYPKEDNDWNDMLVRISNEIKIPTKSISSYKKEALFRMNQKEKITSQAIKKSIEYTR